MVKYCIFLLAAVMLQNVFAQPVPVQTSDEIAWYYTRIIHRFAATQPVKLESIELPGLKNLRILRSRLSAEDQKYLKGKIIASCPDPLQKQCVYLVFKQQPIYAPQTRVDITNMTDISMRTWFLYITFLQAMKAPFAERRQLLEEFNTLQQQVFAEANGASILAETHRALQNHPSRLLVWIRGILPIICEKRSDTEALLRGDWPEPWTTLRPIFEDGLKILVDEYTSRGRGLLTGLQRWCPSKSMDRPGVLFHPAFLATMCKIAAEPESASASKVWHAMATVVLASENLGYSLRQFTFAELPSESKWLPQMILLKNIVRFLPKADENLCQAFCLYLARLAAQELPSFQESEIQAFLETKAWPGTEPWSYIRPIFEESAGILLAKFSQGNGLEKGLPSWLIQTKMGAHPIFFAALYPSLTKALENAKPESPAYQGAMQYLEWLSSMAESKIYLLHLVKNGEQALSPGHWHIASCLATSMARRGYDLRTLPVELQTKFLIIKALHIDAPQLLLLKQLKEIQQQIINPLPGSKDENIIRYENILNQLLPVLQKSDSRFQEALISIVYDLAGQWVVLCPAKRNDLLQQIMVAILKTNR